LRRGCISLGNIKCSSCGRLIQYPERYLALEEEKGKSQIICMDCCLKRGLVKSESDKTDVELVFDLGND
jgi:sulfur relay (sulfurtransferase) complex TusBCD TusD component (DsrE family)